MSDLEISETDQSKYGKAHGEFHKSFARVVDIYGFFPRRRSLSVKKVTKRQAVFSRTSQ